jgi:hypothetical protein
LYLYDPLVVRALRKRAARGLPVSPQALASPGPFLTVFVWPTLLTMSLLGLWHGAGFGFIAWGFYHGVLLVLYHVAPLDKLLQRRFERAGKPLATVLMFFLVCVGLIFFRASAADVVPLLVSLAWWPAYSLPLLLLGGLVLATELIGYRRGTEFVDVYPSLPWWARGLLLVGAFYGIVFLGSGQKYEFIYFQF